MRDLAIGIDIGTTAVKGIVIDRDGSILKETSRPSELLSPKPGYAEEDPNKWVEGVFDILRELSDLGSRTSAIGISGMVPTLIFVDEEGMAIGNSIQQNDSRAVEEIEYFKRVLDEEEYFRRTGNTINQQVVFPKILWVKRNEPDRLKKARWIMGSYSYVSFKLTGVASLEKNWALESGMWRIEGGWDEEILKATGIDERILPEVRDPWEIIGETSKEVEKATGFPSGIPVIAGSADHIASALATGMNEDGDLLLKFGGAGDVLYVTKDLKLSKKLFIDYHDIPGMFVLNGCMASSGSIVKWFRSNFASLNYEDLTKLASEIPPGSEGLVMLPYFLGEKTPIFDPKARGTLVGLSLHHGVGHIFRSILEAVAYGFRHHVDVLKEEGFEIKRVFMSNGGARSDLWRQIVADVIGMDAVYVKDHPGSSLGAAFLAGKATGLFEDWNEMEKFTRDKMEVKHDTDVHGIYEGYYRLYRELYERLKDFFVELHEMSRG